MIPIFRSTVPGEERDEGNWVRLECASNTIVAHVRVGDEVRTYRGTWEAAEFTSHRDDRQGDITCGPRAEPEAVYVTWRPGPDGTRELVAVEILPL